MAEEYTVERALAELREMFPDAHFRNVNHSISEQGESRTDYATVQVDNWGWRGTTPQECMAQVKQWRESQS